METPPRMSRPVAAQTLMKPMQAPQEQKSVNSPIEVAVLRTMAELEAIREVWESWPGNRDSEIDSYLTSLRLNPQTVRPHVMVVYHDGRPDALLVGRIDKGHIRCRLGYSSVSFAARIMCFVYGALRGNPTEENCGVLIDEVLRSLSDGEADVAYLNFLRRESNLCRLAMTRPGFLMRDHVNLTQPHFAARLPATVEDFYRGLSPKVRKNQKWQARKLVNHFSGAVRISCVRELADVEDLIRDVEHVAAKSYQRGLGVGFVVNAATREHLRLKARRGWLRAYVLYIEERPCAFWIGDINGATFGSDYIGYDAEFAGHSPGMYLVMKVIESFCDGNREGVTEVDFGQGHAQYKQVLANEEWTESLVQIFAPTVKGISLNLVRTLLDGMNQSTKKALASTSLLQKIRRKWRSRLTPAAAIHA